MVFGIATVMQGEATAAAIVLDGRVWDIGSSALALSMALPAGGLFEYLQSWDAVLPVLGELAARIAAGEVAEEHARGLEEVRLATPIRLPRKVFCIGANYTDHLDEMGVPRSAHPDPSKNPFFFLKPGSTAVVGPGPTVHIPAKCEIFDWEAEAVAVFGKRGRNIPASHALDYVAGYTLAIDFTSRNQMSIPDHPLRWDLVLGKCQDAMTPVGPVFVPRQFIDGDDFEFKLSVNGVVKQSASTRDMIHSLRDQVAAVSEGITIEPGDLMLTGSPAGVGMPQGQKLSPGDVVTIESAATGAMQVIIQGPPG